MSDFRADLHCHTTCSDGSLSPTQVVERAAAIGLQGLSITDHDTIAAYAEALPVAQKLGISLVSGVEFSAVHADTNVHILAYAFPLDSPLIQGLCERHHARRRQRCCRILERLAQKGIDLQRDSSLLHAIETSSVGRPHVAAAMVRNGSVRSIEEAFKRYLGEGRSCYVSVDPITAEETLAVIHEAGGLAVLAHPHLLPEERVLLDVLKLPFDGIEAYYARFGQYRNQRWVDIAAQRGWLITGGSDFHGEAKPQIALGVSWVNAEVFQVLWEHYEVRS